MSAPSRGRPDSMRTTSAASLLTGSAPAATSTRAVSSTVSRVPSRSMPLSVATSKSVLPAAPVSVSECSARSGNSTFPPSASPASWRDAGPISETMERSGVRSAISTWRPILYIRRSRRTPSSASAGVSIQSSSSLRRRIRMSATMRPLGVSIAA